MNHLQILNAALCAFGVAMGTVTAVVCILYVANLDVDPGLKADLPLLLAGTAGFAALALAGGLAFAAHRRQWGARWLLQALPGVPLAALAAFLATLRG